MKRTKKALAVVLSLSMLASITPQIVLANSNIPDRYEEVSEMQAIVKDAEVHAYVTRNGGTAELTDSNGVETTFTQGIGYREYTATPADGWVWNPKNLQYIMGHSNISITLNLYAHASEVGANKEMRSMIA